MSAAQAPLLTPGEVATRLHVAEQTLAQWRWKGVGPPFLKVGRAVRYAPQDLERWISQNTRRTEMQR